MGLDIAFNRDEAVEAGLVLKHNKHRDTEQAYICRDDGDEEGYMYWMQPEELVAVPNTDHYVENYGLGNEIVVRANKWGRTYEPLTNWLKQRGIAWSEF